MSEHLYKFREFNKDHLEALSKNTLYFSTSKKFNDPLDCSLETPLLAASLEDIIPYIEEKFGKSSASYYKDNPKQLINLIKPIFEKEEASFLEASIFDELANRLILCMTESYRSPLMWSHYSFNHTGFCLSFKKKSLVEHPSIFKHKPADYSGKLPSIVKPLLDPECKDSIKDLLLEMLFKKAPDWKYENEYRLILKELDSGDGNKPFVYPEDSLDMIIFGMKSTEDNIEQVKSILRGRKVKYQKMRRSDYSFELFPIEA